MDGPDEEGTAYPILEFSMKLNDVKGGQVKATIYVDTGSGTFQHLSTESSSGIAEYDPSVITGDIWNDQIECPIEPPAGGGIAGKAKIVFDFVYPDGEKDTIETEALPVHSGTYVKTNLAYGKGGYDSGSYTDPETNQEVYTMSCEVILDRALVVPDKVTHDDSWSLCLYDPWTEYPNPTCELYTDENDNSILRFTYSSDTPFPAGDYWFAPIFYYPEDANNVWRSPDYYLEFYYDPS